MQITSEKIIHTDVLIIGGGTAGCYAALTLRSLSDASVIIAEKADIRRSGCLAAGVNALNAYITKGHTPQFYVDYAKKDAAGIVREDLLLTISEGLNEVTRKLEDLGLVILKDEKGEYVARGTRNIKINGENIKTILADAVKKLDGVQVINHLNITDYIVRDNTMAGALGFDMRTGTAYEIRAKAVLCATGGAAGLYRPNNPGFSRHKMWYCPFNTGAGYAMGIRAGAEMTTFEMRFIALRCKDTIAPTGTIAQGVGAKQVNARGDVYEQKYGLTTSQRLYGTVRETLDGNGRHHAGSGRIAPQGLPQHGAEPDFEMDRVGEIAESAERRNRRDRTVRRRRPYGQRLLGRHEPSDDDPPPLCGWRRRRRLSAEIRHWCPGRRGNRRQGYGPPGPERCIRPR